MSLFKNIAEIQEFIPVEIAFEFIQIGPFIREVERKYIIPIVSKEQYDDLNTAYNASETPTLTEAQQNLLFEIRTALAPLVFWKWIPFGQVKISNNGINIYTNNATKTAFQWQVNELESSAMNSGLNALETLLEFLETNSAIYTLWKNSDSYSIDKKLIVASAKVFHQYYPINESRYLYLMMMPMCRIAEINDVKPILGTILYNKVKSYIINNITSSAAVEITSLSGEFNTIGFALTNQNIVPGSITIAYTNGSDSNTFEFIDNSTNTCEAIINGDSYPAIVNRESGIITIAIPTISFDGTAEISYQYYAENPATDYDELLKYIRPVVVYSTLLKSTVRLSLTINENGISLFNNSSSNANKAYKEATDSRLQIWMEDIGKELITHKQQLVEYLDANHNQYPDYPYVESTGGRFENKATNTFFYAGR